MKKNEGFAKVYTNAGGNKKAFGKSYVKMIFRAILGSIGRFAAIFAITALGIGFMSGLLATTSDMKMTMGYYLNSLNTMDIFIKSSFGFSMADLEAVRSINGVKDAETRYTMDAIVETSENESHVTRIYSVQQQFSLSDDSGVPQSLVGLTPATRINMLEIVEGRLPAALNECVVQHKGGSTVDVKIGEKLRIADETLTYTNTYGRFSSLDQVFAQREFTVTGIVRSPLHISWDREPSRIGRGSLALVVFVPPSAFSLPVAADIFVTVEGAKDVPAFTGQYRDLVKPVKKQIEDLWKQRELSPPFLDEDLVDEDLVGDIPLSESAYNVSHPAIPNIWYILDRSSNQGFAIYESNAEKIDDVARVFPAFFLLIAVLVVLSTMTRMVEEDRLQIGTLKALGYKKRTIILQYLLYCVLTGILGSIVGMTIGFQAFPRIIYRAFATQGYLPPFIAAFHWHFALISCGVVLLSTLFSAIYACYRCLHEKPAALLLPKAPKSGKRILLESIPFIWNRMNFSSKVTARNLIRHKKHFFMTIIGIAGCTALITAGFGLRDSIVTIARTQFTDILKYDMQIGVHISAESGETDAIKTFLPPNTRTLEIYSGGAAITSGEKRQDVSIFCVQTESYVKTVNDRTEKEDFSDFITLMDRKSKKNLDFHGNSVLMGENVASTLELKSGDIFTLENADGKRGQFLLSGIVENYVGMPVYIGFDAWKTQFFEEPAINSMLVSLADAEKARFAAENTAARSPQNSDPQASLLKDRLYTTLLDCPNVENLQFLSDQSNSFEKLLSSISLVVIFLIVAAGALAIIVLYNLTYININERTREIAALRVLGFHRDEAAYYIFREAAILSLIGAIAGLALGIPLHSFIISVAENPDLMFGRNIAVPSYVFSFIITIVFSAIVDVILIKKIITIKMSESLKSVE
ncbi:MAG: hypothetical protein Ta2B_23910 [Termitinemataceae bacterium]|nr:MAG: hypothetical protein Ta2B_23910 [Termitinemataceae bacterium]